MCLNHNVITPSKIDLFEEKLGYPSMRTNKISNAKNRNSKFFLYTVDSLNNKNDMIQFKIKNMRKII